jgi:hypothetical protein
MSAAVDDLLRDLAAELAIAPPPELAARIRVHISQTNVGRTGRGLTRLAAATAVGVIAVLGFEGTWRHSVTVEVVPVRPIAISGALADSAIRPSPAAAPPASEPASTTRHVRRAAETVMCEPEVITNQPAVLKAMWERVGRFAERRLDTDVIEVQGPEPPAAIVSPVTIVPIAVEQIRAVPVDRRSRR